MNRLIRKTLMVAAVISIASGTNANDNRVDDRRTSGHPAVRHGEALSLDAAIRRALELSPRLDVAAAGVSAADQRALQAGLWPNPEIELEVENFGGDDELRGFETAESTFVLTQPFPLGGKAGRRRAVAESTAQLARWDLEAVRLDIVAETQSAFAGVLAAQQRRELATRLLEVSEDFGRVVQARVDAGKVSPVEATRAQIETSQVRVARARAERSLNAARARLAATWGSTTADFGRASGNLPEPTLPPSFEDLRRMVMETPEMRRLEDEIERQERTLSFEKALAIPDLSLGVGPRRFQETGHSAWVAGLSLSIPVFDRNQGGKKAAEYEIERARQSSETTRVALVTELAVVREQLLAAAEASRSIQSDIIPAATSALAAVEMGYREGKFGFLDVIAAQRSFFEASTLLLDSLEEYALARTELERLVGGPLQSVTDANTTDGEAR